MLLHGPNFIVHLKKKGKRPLSHVAVISAASKGSAMSASGIPEHNIPTPGTSVAERELSKQRLLQEESCRSRNEKRAF